MRKVIEYYDKVAKDFADEWYANELLLPYLEEFMKYLPKNPKVIDLGCGGGFESMRLKRLGAEVVGLDLSNESIKIAKERNPEIQFFVQDILEDYSYVGKVDGILCSAILIHFDNNELRVVFEQMGKVLKSNAHALILVQDGVGKNVDKSIREVGGEVYDKNCIEHTLDELKTASKGLMTFVKEIPNTNEKEIGKAWRFYIFKSGKAR